MIAAAASGVAQAGASTGSGEALDLRDGGTRFAGFGVEKAVSNVNTLISDAITGMQARWTCRTLWWCRSGHPVSVKRWSG